MDLNFQGHVLVSVTNTEAVCVKRPAIDITWNLMFFGHTNALLQPRHALVT